MLIETKIQKWGNGLAIRIAGVMRDIPHFKIGTPVEVEVTEEGLLIKKITNQHPTLFPYSEQELLSAITTDSAHVELLAKPLKNEF